MSARKACCAGVKSRSMDVCLLRRVLAWRRGCFSTIVRFSVSWLRHGGGGLSGALFRPLFAGRVLPFDLACPRAYATLMAEARTSGLAVATADGYIAAIAIANGLAVAARDTGPFETAGAAVIDPWQT
jgi:hypothetical protein